MKENPILFLMEKIRNHERLKFMKFKLWEVPTL